MRTEWDYTDLAEAYLKRPDYADGAIDAMLGRAGIGPGARACDVGAGVAHLTLKLAERGLEVVSVEPNDAMRRLGMERTAHLPAVRWFEGVGEDTGQEARSFDIVTFGSSFNVTDRARALVECRRILKPGGWFAAMWNHRDLEDLVQARIERLIQERVPGYQYGTRREDQGPVIEASGLFEGVERVEGTVLHTLPVGEVVAAWRSHATLERQAGERFAEVVDAIEAMLRGLGHDTLTVPYTTRIWLARLRPESP